jgi:hypothetical protein
LSWKAALDLPGAGQMKHLRSFMEMIPLEDLRPAQELLADTGGISDRIACIRAGDYVAVYSAQGKPIRLFIDRLGKKTELWDNWWYNVRYGFIEKSLPKISQGIFAFTPPTSGYGQDWLLVMRRGPKTPSEEITK